MTLPGPVARAEESFDVRATALPEIDEFIAAFGLSHACPQRAIFRARVAIAELAANALEHGRPKPDGDTFRIALEKAAAGLLVTYADTTTSFDPAALGAPEASSERNGGRGLAIIRQLADEIAYRRDGDWNIVEMRFGPLSPHAGRGLG